MPRGTILPATKKQARPLSQLPTPLALHSQNLRGLLPGAVRDWQELRQQASCFCWLAGKFGYPGTHTYFRRKTSPPALQTPDTRTPSRSRGERASRQRDRSGSAIRRRGVAVGRISQLAQIGDASLKVLRDKRLYRSTHKTFEDYCQERFGIGRNYVNRRVVFAGIL